MDSAPNGFTDAYPGTLGQDWRTSLILASSPGETIDRARAPIFVVGCGHSGTTLMCRLLGMHRNVFPVPLETFMFLDNRDLTFPKPTIDSIAQEATKLLHKTVDYEHFRTERERVIHLANLMAAASAKNRWVEKTPRHIHRIDLICNAFPDATILLMIRDGRDVAVSLRDRYGAPDGFVRGVYRWTYDNEAGEQHWGRSNVKCVRLEDLIVNLEETMKSVFAFVGEEFDPIVTTYNKHPPRETVEHRPSEVGPTNWVHYRKWLAQQPLFDTRRKWIGLMNEDEKLLFKKIAGNMLIRYKYAENNDW